jgi:hypothetical protein
VVCPLGTLRERVAGELRKHLSKEGVSQMQNNGKDNSVRGNCMNKGIANGKLYAFMELEAGC